MATISNGHVQIEVADGSSGLELHRELNIGLDIRFDCHEGVCHTCVMRVEEGANNLSMPGDLEVHADKGFRLMCQVTVNEGHIEVRPPEIDASAFED